MADVARQNLGRTQSRHRARGFEIVVGDARALPISDDVSIVYIANPFVGTVFGAALERIIESLDRRPRRLRIAYVNPVEQDRVLATGRFREAERADARWMHWVGVDPAQFRRYQAVIPSGS